MCCAAKGLQMLLQPMGGGQAARGTDAAPGEIVSGQTLDDRPHPPDSVIVVMCGTGRHCRPRNRIGHPQHPCPAASASALAAVLQQLPEAAASRAVPQHGDPAAAVSDVEDVGALPQHRPAAGGVNASARSPVKPPVVGVLVIVLVSDREMVGGLVDERQPTGCLGAGGVEAGVGPAGRSAHLRAGIAELHSLGHRAWPA